jgi:hypothetical protein
VGRVDAAGDGAASADVECVLKKVLKNGMTVGWWYVAWRLVVVMGVPLRANVDIVLNISGQSMDTVRNRIRSTGLK